MDNFLSIWLQVPIPIPTPLPIPEVPEEWQQISAPFWDLENWAAAGSAFQTVFVFAEHYRMISIATILAVLVLVIGYFAKFVGDRNKDI